MCVYDPNKCTCIGHRIPGVRHVAACCNEPHIDQVDPEPEDDVLNGWVR